MVDITIVIGVIMVYKSISVYIHIYIWVNYNDLTVPPHWNHG